jgi:hypothetical protein
MKQSNAVSNSFASALYSLRDRYFRSPSSAAHPCANLCHHWGSEHSILLGSYPVAIAALQPLFLLLADYTDAEAFSGIAVALELGPRFLGLFQREADVNVWDWALVSGM